MKHQLLSIYSVMILVSDVETVACDWHTVVNLCFKNTKLYFKIFRQEVSNRLARLSVHALACLGGYMSQDGGNPVVQKSLSALITGYLANKLESGNYAEVC